MYLLFLRPSSLSRPVFSVNDILRIERAAARWFSWPVPYHRDHVHKSRHCPLSWAKLIQSTPLYSIYLRSVLILSFHLQLGISNCPFRFSWPKFCMHPISHVLAAQFTWLIIEVNSSRQIEKGSCIIMALLYNDDRSARTCTILLRGTPETEFRPLLLEAWAMVNLWTWNATYAVHLILITLFLQVFV
jgi:hypothetical protein